MKTSLQITLFISIILLIFFAYNAKEIVYAFYNASGQFEKSQNIEGYYNNATVKYTQGEYSAAEDIFETSSGTLENSYLAGEYFYNRASSLYKIGENKSENTEKMEYYQKSRDTYSQALDILSDEETQKNLEFVEYQIKKLQQEEAQKNQDGNNEASSGGESQENRQQEQTGEQGQGQSEKGENGEDGEQSGENSAEESQEGKESTAGKESGQELSDETRAALEQQAQALQEQQGEIGQFYNKNYEERRDPLDDFNSFFGRDQMFDNSGLNNDSGEKDW